MFVGIQRGLELRGNSTKNSRFLFFSQKLLKSRFLRACLLQTRPFRMDGDSQLTIFESQIRMRDTTLRVRPSKKRARSSRRAFFPFSEEVDGSARAFLFSDSTTNRAGSVFLGKGGKFWIAERHEKKNDIRTWNHVGIFVLKNERMIHWNNNFNMRN